MGITGLVLDGDLDLESMIMCRPESASDQTHFPSTFILVLINSDEEASE